MSEENIQPEEKDSSEDLQRYDDLMERLSRLGLESLFETDDGTGDIPNPEELGLDSVSDEHLRLAIRTAFLSQWSYRDKNKIQDAFGHRQCEVWEVGDIQAFGIVGHDNRLIITFRGSKNLKNWIRNASTKLLKTSLNGFEAWVHSGFLLGYHLVAGRIRNYIERMKAKMGADSVLVTGHSLGGALAQICALDVRPVESLITFGQPQAVSKATARAMPSVLPTKLYRRYVNVGDIFAPNYPLSFKYDHAGTRVKIAYGQKSFESSGLQSGPQDPMVEPTEIMNLEELLALDDQALLEHFSAGKDLEGWPQYIGHAIANYRIVLESMVASEGQETIALGNQGQEGALAAV